MAKRAVPLNKCRGNIYNKVEKKSRAVEKLGTGGRLNRTNRILGINCPSSSRFSTATVHIPQFSTFHEVCSSMPEFVSIIFRDN